MSFPRYPKYKDSGVEWLGDVPEHWGISRLGFESWVRARLGWKGLKAEEYVDDGFAFLSTPNIKGTEIDFDNVNYINQLRFDESPEIKLRLGDVLLAKDGSTLGTVNVVRTLPRPATVNSSIAVITPNPTLNGVFLYYLFASSFMENTIQRIKGGMGVPHLFQEDLNKFYLPIPEVVEQTSIGAFLDRETAKIDGLVGEQRRLIALLKEKRQAVISHAVTKGLNPHAPMKPSGIEWLGDVPAHWALMRLKRIVVPTRKITYGIVQPGELDPNGRYMIRGKDYSSGWCEPEDVFRVSSQIEIPYTRSRMQANDLVMTIVGAGVGTIAVIPDWLDGSNITQTSARIALDLDRSDPWFISYSLQGVIGQRNLERHVYGSAQPRLNIEHVDAYLVTVPPLEEQRSIVAQLNEELSQLSELTAEAERAIDLLQERRTALISAAVTGKIDVRGLAETGAV